MRDRTGVSKRRSLALLASSAAAVTVLWSARSANGAPDNWVAGTGNWSGAGNWSAGVPVGGSSASIVDSDGVGRSIRYDYTGPNVTLTSLTMDLTGGTFQSIAIVQIGNTLAATNETVGSSGVGIFNQTGGTNSMGSALLVAANVGSTGTYNLSFGAALSANNETVGNSGIGRFNQSGGTNSMSLALLIAANVSSTGTYTLSGGATLSANNETVGNSGMGAFNQSGGSNSMGSTLFVAVNVGSTGTYNLSSNGTLTASGYENVGYGGIGVFNQTGGSNLAVGKIGIHGGLDIGVLAGATGTYILSGTSSVLSAPAGVGMGDSGTGIFNQTGGSNINGGVSLGTKAGSFGTYNLSGGTCDDNSTQFGVYIGGSVNPGGTGVFNVSGDGTLTSIGSITVFNTAGTSLNQSGGMIDTGTLIVDKYVGLQAGFLTAGAFNLNTGGTFNQSGGTAVFTTISQSQGSFSQTAGSLTFTTYTQSGGSDSMGPLPLGASGVASSYSLSGGALTSGSITVNSGGTFSMTNGALSAPSFSLNGGIATFPIINLDSGVAVPAVGVATNTFGPAFTFTSGTLGAVVSYLGFSTGVTSFVQPASIAFGPTNLYVGYNAGSMGTYVLDAGVALSASNETVGNTGTGVFNQSGGTNLMGSTLTIAGNLGSTGTYNLDAGAALSASNETVGNSGAGVFNQIGGTNSLGSTLFVAANVGSTGTYNLSSNGTLTASAYENIGYGGVGIFNQSGGSNTAIGTIGVHGGIDVGFLAGGMGTYILSGNNSVLNSPAGVGVGDSGTGIFNQTGGLDISGGFSLGVSSGSVGVYNLSGGTCDNNSTQFSVYIGGSVNPGGKGVFNVSGSGTLTSIGSITVFDTPGSILNQSGGFITTPKLLLDGNSFSQTAGIAQFSDISGAGQLSITGGVTTLALGGSASQLGSLSVAGTGTLDMQLGGHSQGVNYDLINVSGATSLGGTLQVDLVNGFMPLIGDQFTILTSGNVITGGFADITSADSWFAYTVSSGAQNKIVQLTVTSVPEPAALSFVVLAGFLSVRRRRSQRR